MEGGGGGRHEMRPHCPLGSARVAWRPLHSAHEHLMQSIAASGGSAGRQTGEQVRARSATAPRHRPRQRAPLRLAIRIRAGPAPRPSASKAAAPARRRRGEQALLPSPASLHLPTFIWLSTALASFSSSHTIDQQPTRWPYRPMFLANDCGRGCRGGGQRRVSGTAVQNPRPVNERPKPIARAWWLTRMQIALSLSFSPRPPGTASCGGHLQQRCEWPAHRGRSRPTQSPAGSIEGQHRGWGGWARASADAIAVARLPNTPGASLGPARPTWCTQQQLPHRQVACQQQARKRTWYAQSRMGSSVFSFSSLDSSRHCSMVGSTPVAERGRKAATAVNQPYKTPMRGEHGDGQAGGAINAQHCPA